MKKMITENEMTINPAIQAGTGILSSGSGGQLP